MTGGGGEPVGEHERFMSRALELAELGRSTTLPNPMVGCVLVRESSGIVGEGWHERAGDDHAETRALAAAGELARGATVYVTLEPCNHHGNTPPCTEALISAGVRRVVIAGFDPDPRVAGSGVRRLQEAGITVVEGVLRDEADALNAAYLRMQRSGRPFVLYKTAMTLDGKIATRSGQSRWITGEAARELVQRWRSRLDAVAVGINTVLLDDPLLTARVDDGRTPVKVVFDSVGRTPPDAGLFAPDRKGEAPRVVLFVTDKAPAGRLEALRAAGAEVITVSAQRGRALVTEALRALRERGVRSLLLEGGGTLAWSFLEAEAVDQVAWFIGPKLLGGSGATPLGGLGMNAMADALELEAMRTELIGGDLLVTGGVRYQPTSSTSSQTSSQSSSQSPSQRSSQASSLRSSSQTSSQTVETSEAAGTVAGSESKSTPAAGPAVRPAAADDTEAT
ncbi:MAG: bifunctional diaminohydroxyphosphoribosylaminopyrimidine deaminase/5-amino-6-(5-phosphoribosylamino)uracil reductase RibD [Trueperaceae bacterium]